MTTDYREVVSALRALADALDALPKDSGPEVASAAPAAPAQEEKAQEEKAQEEKVLRLEDVRAVLSDISRQGKTKEMKALLTKFGATKLSEVDPSSYTDLVRDAEVIRNA